MAESGVVSRAEIFARPEWQMSPGERAALEGLLVQLSPDLSIEIGTAEDGSLQRLAAYSREAHAIDLTDQLLAPLPANATFHNGDSKVVLPDALERFAAEGRNVDFVLVDGDHTEDGVRSDLTNLLDSEAVRRTIILLHDAFNPDVRRGIESVSLASNAKVVGFDLDFVPGRLAKAGPFADQLLGGFALVIVDEPTALTGARTVELGFWSLRPRAGVVS